MLFAFIMSFSTRLKSLSTSTASRTTRSLRSSTACTIKDGRIRKWLSYSHFVFSCSGLANLARHHSGDSFKPSFRLRDSSCGHLTQHTTQVFDDLARISSTSTFNYGYEYVYSTNSFCLTDGTTGSLKTVFANSARKTRSSPIH